MDVDDGYRRWPVPIFGTTLEQTGYGAIAVDPEAVAL
jgi:hypothetical protein